ncbi:MAG: NAD(P)H-binding protein [Deltaproteobacteria bacterium]|nr:NAD(P)H-binding protein [Deltaproteobacteria bacterium]
MRRRPAHSPAAAPSPPVTLQEATIAVTGATGFLGRYLVDVLQARGARVVAVVRSPEKAPELEARGVELRRADLTEPEALEEGFRGADAVVANAGLFARRGRHRRQRRALRALLPQVARVHRDQPAGLAQRDRCSLAGRRAAHGQGVQLDRLPPRRPRVPHRRPPPAHGAGPDVAVERVRHQQGGGGDRGLARGRRARHRALGGSPRRHLRGLRHELHAGARNADGLADQHLPRLLPQPGGVRGRRGRRGGAHSRERCVRRPRLQPGGRARHHGLGLPARVARRRRPLPARDDPRALARANAPLHRARQGRTRLAKPPHDGRHPRAAGSGSGGVGATANRCAVC